jgi:hypothetical protein
VNPPTPCGVLTVPEIALWAHVSESTVVRRARFVGEHGEFIPGSGIRFFRVGRQWRVSLAAVERFEADRRDLAQLSEPAHGDALPARQVLPGSVAPAVAGGLGSQTRKAG